MRAGIDYYVSEKTTLALTTRIWRRDGDEAATNRTTVANASLPDKVLYAFFTDNVGDDKTRGLYSSLNFKHEFDKKLGKTFTLDLDHSNINSTNINNLTIYPEDFPTQRSLSQQIVTQPIGLYVIKSDYNHPIDSTFKLSLGLKSSIATIDNGLSFTRAGIISPTESNDFLYKENINAAYINASKTIGKFDLSAGLRTEQTVINGKTDEVTVLSRNYTQFFPSGSAVYRLNDHMAIQSSYAKRVNRPNFNQQNPFTYFIDSLTYTRGNPTLKPEIANVSKLTFTYDNQPVFGISYSVIDSVIVDNAPKLEGTRTFTTADNIAHQSRLELQLNFPIKFGKYIDGFGGNQLIRNAYDATYQDIKYNASRWHWLAYWPVNVKLPKDIKVEIGFTGIFSCKKTGPAEALVSIRDTNGKAVAGATVVLRQDTVINANTRDQANINEKKTTDSQANAFFSFQWEAVLNVEVSKGTLTETDYIRLEQSKTVQKTVVLK